ncbi:DUF1616 domain-containing protein [Halorarum salinum]|uniref:DUF1616 domain-containing protein n=1 Tax=Halorarum salinum TaxID=2743089 RepID=A0A7D5QDB5_9EURY|nr:DUF1616 domain-containing protein [Halobaculum salinum]QLG64317.1 DUF1616 domain-containing protein [Halobaculum salinum]
MTTREARLGTARRAVPLDALLAVVYAVGIAALVYVSPVWFAGPVRVAVALPLVLFLPGYAILAVLYPGRWRDPDAATAREVGPLGHEGLTWGERAAVSFAASLALVPLLAVLLSVARVPLDPGPIAISLAAVTAIGGVVGALRRLQLPADQRLGLPVARWGEELHGATVGAPTYREALLNVLLLLAVVAALTGLAYGLVAPPSGAGYTEVALLTDGGEELVAGNYTTEFAAGESAPLVLTVENREGDRRAYTAIVSLERVRGSGDEFAVVERAELTRLSMEVDDGVTAREPHTIEPSLRGDDLRLSYYVYEGDAPSDPSEDVPKEHLYLWIDVGQGAEDDGSDAAGANSDGDDSGGADSGADDASGADAGEGDADEADSSGTESAGNETAGTESAGDQTAGNETDGNGTAGNETDGNGTAGNETDGNGTAGNETDGNGTAGNETDGNGTAGNETDGNGTAGDDGSSALRPPRSGGAA